MTQKKDKEKFGREFAPECDSCKAMRKQEIKEVVVELLKER